MKPLDLLSQPPRFRWGGIHVVPLLPPAPNARLVGLAPVGNRFLL
jgi:hypothetical protein